VADGSEGDILLAFDFGLRRLGVATANLRTRTASPLATLEVRRELPWSEIDRVIEEWRPAQLVVGLPQGPGTESVARHVADFVAALTKRYGLPVATVDETLTSAAAHTELAAGRRSGYLRRRVGKGKTDRIAACLIAEQWLSDQPPSGRLE
jgi:putative Holliday junction resolvase